MITTYTGPMFSGKSTGLLNKYETIWNKENILAFKPKIDNRDYGIIKSRNMSVEIPAICINDLSEIKNYVNDKTRTIFIDEAQFLLGDVKEIIDLSIDNDIDFYISGCNMTSEQKPFGIMPYILAISNEIYIYEAVCFDCNKQAPFSYYKYKKETDNVIGNDEYIPLCRKCLIKRRKNEKE